MIGAAIETFVQTLLAGLVSTDYAHDPVIDAPDGIYNVDCSAFVSYVLSQVAPVHLSAIPLPDDHTRLLAEDYHAFIAALPPAGAHQWLPIAALANALPGDVVAWQRTDAARDTGHVFFVAAAPAQIGQGGAAVISPRTD